MNRKCKNRKMLTVQAGVLFLAGRSQRLRRTGILYILTVSILITSCATIVNRPYKYVTVHTTEPSKIIYRQDTVNTTDNKAHLKVERKKELLSIVVSTDSLTKSINIEPSSSIMYWSNIYFNLGTGMLVDMNNPKRYSYPDKVYINSENAESKYYLYGKANNKGELYLHLSLPIINFFRMIPENEGIKANKGFWGFAVGLDYYYSKNQFVHLGYSDVSDISYISVAAFWSPDYEEMRSECISLSNNHKIGRFTVGYGLAFAKNTWIYSKWGFLFIPLGSIKRHNAFGFIFPNYFQLGEYFNMGVVYRPTFYRPNVTNKLSYEHLISIDFAWKIRLKK